ncbi:WD40 repeat-like protein, partial [Rhizopogon vinicolor AM-OR11-026]
HTSHVNGVVHLPNGRSIITCSHDSSLRRWDLESGAQTGDDWRDEGDEAAVWCIALSPNSKTIASGSSEGTVTLWNVEKEKVIAKWAGHTMIVRSLCWSADSEYVVSGSYDGMARVWNVKSGKTPRKTMRGHTDNVNGVVHLADGRNIITCSDDGSLRRWDLERGAQIGDDWRDEQDKAQVRCIALSPNGKTVASGSRGGTVRLWNVETEKVIAKWAGHTNIVISMSWSADGTRVMSGSGDGTARVWDVESGKTVLGPIEAHGAVVAVVYSPDMKKIATGGANENGVKIWDATTGELLSTLKHENEVRSLAWTSDQKKLISAARDFIRIFE